MAKYLTGSRSSDSELVRELASEHGTGFGFRDSASELEAGAIDALRGASATLRAKAPDELEPYRMFVLELARVGRSRGGRRRCGRDGSDRQARGCPGVALGPRLSHR